MTDVIVRPSLSETLPASRRLTDLVGALRQMRAMPEAVNALVAAAVEVVPSAAHASITLLDADGVPRTAAATSQTARSIDAAQHDHGAGPSVEAVHRGTPVHADSDTIGYLWPHLGPVLDTAGVSGMLSLPLGTPTAAGALNFFSASDAAFASPDTECAELLGSIAAFAVASQLKTMQFLEAIENRDLIGQAKGILMERLHLTADDAFQVLVRVSQTRHIKLRELARLVAETGQSPDEVGPPRR